jgi:hypothetical protein
MMCKVSNILIPYMSSLLKKMKMELRLIMYNFQL